MARPKKDDKAEEAAPAAAAAAASGTVSVEEFRKTRDSVIQGLTGLQLAVGNLLSAYMSHCNSLLGEGGAEPLEGSELNRLTGAFAAGVAVEAAVVESKKEKKKRQKKERDPDQPKRPLTAAFLYGQTARPIIKKDLEEQLAPGEKLGANAVNEEVTKRWNAMSEDEKQLWRNAYQENMVKYKQEIEDYTAKKGTTITVNLDDIADLAGGIAESVSPAPVMKSAPAAAKPAPKRRKTGKENGAVVSITTQSSVPVPIAAKAAPAASTPAKAEKKDKKKKEDSPEDTRKKRSRKSKGGDEAEEVVEGEKKERKRKRKTDNA